MDVIAQSARPYGQRAVLKFAHYVGAKTLSGRHTPGTFTNQQQKNYEEPRLLIVTDPRTDSQVGPDEKRRREKYRRWDETEFRVPDPRCKPRHHCQTILGLL